jgi:hypothetical protein
MASNIQRGPRRMDASDWIRIKRLNGAVGNMMYVYTPISPAPPRTFNDIINPNPRSEPESGRRVYTEFGTSKIRRPASNYTDYKASQTSDYVLETPNGRCGVGKNLTIHKLCTCATRSAIKHNGVCLKCSYDPIVVRN